MTPEYTVAGLLLAAITALSSTVAYIFKIYNDGVARQLAAKDQDILWLRSKVEQLLGTTGKAVSTTLALTEKPRDPAA